MKDLLRRSAFWMALAAFIGQALAAAGVINQTDWQQYFAGAIAYIVGRVFSEGAKKAVKPSA